MIKITEDKERYYSFFKEFNHFIHFIRFVINDYDPVIYVDCENNPKTAILYFPPAYFIWGNPTKENIESVCQIFNEDSWVITNNDEWNQVLKDIYQENIESHDRILFSNDNVTIDHVLQMRKQVPKGLSIVPIEERHLEKGIIHDDVISRFFQKSDFLKEGFGFVLLDDRDIAQGFALTNYPITSNEVELYFRVGYDSFEKYRNQGIGTLLCTYFIEEALKRGFVPIWDSAHETSAHIARKLGYVDSHKWKMHHIHSKKKS